jgi:hypothetical protein
MPHTEFKKAFKVKAEKSAKKKFDGRESGVTEKIAQLREARATLQFFVKKGNARAPQRLADADKILDGLEREFAAAQALGTQAKYEEAYELLGPIKATAEKSLQFVVDARDELLFQDPENRIEIPMGKDWKAHRRRSIRLQHQRLRQARRGRRRGSLSRRRREAAERQAASRSVAHRSRVRIGSGCRTCSQGRDRPDVVPAEQGRGVGGRGVRERRVVDPGRRQPAARLLRPLHRGLQPLFQPHQGPAGEGRRDRPRVDAYEGDIVDNPDGLLPYGMNTMLIQSLKMEGTG